jgi:hypothetical protein
MTKGSGAESRTAEVLEKNCFEMKHTKKKKRNRNKETFHFDLNSWVINVACFYFFVFHIGN